MAEKKVPQEPCIICGHNPCDCGKPRSRKQELKKHVQPQPKEDDES